MRPIRHRRLACCCLLSLPLYRSWKNKHIRRRHEQLFFHSHRELRFRKNKPAFCHCGQRYACHQYSLSLPVAHDIVFMTWIMYLIISRLFLKSKRRQVFLAPCKMGSNKELYRGFDDQNTTMASPSILTFIKTDIKCSALMPNELVDYWSRGLSLYVLVKISLSFSKAPSILAGP